MTTTKLREAESKATKGEWGVIKGQNDIHEETYELVASDGTNGGLPVALVYDGQAVWLPRGQPEGNADLIALTRNCLIPLLDHVDALEAARANRFTEIEDFATELSEYCKRFEAEQKRLESIVDSTRIALAQAIERSGA